MPMHPPTDTHDGSRNFANAPLTSHKLGQSVHKTRYFNNEVSVTTLSERETPEHRSTNFTTWRQEMSTILFLQVKTPKEIHAKLTEILGGTCTIVCHRHKLGRQD